jgi:hypothetical protein
MVSQRVTPAGVGDKRAVDARARSGDPRSSKQGAVRHLPGRDAPEQSQQAPYAAYYFSQISGLGRRLDGYFDYRIKDTDEAITHGTSTDGGLTWSVDGTKLRLNGICPANDASTNAGDNGQGHPFIMTVRLSRHRNGCSTRLTASPRLVTTEG